MNAKFYLTLVEEFHAAFRYFHPTPEKPVFDETTLRVSTLHEEHRELMHARCKVDELDALCDLQYFLSGTVLCMGFRELFTNALVSAIQHPSAGLSHVQALFLWISCFEKAAHTRNVNGAVTALCKLQLALWRAVEQRGFALVFDLAFAEVHRSNMGKFWTDEEIFELANEQLANTKCDLTRESAGDGKYIIRRGDGKIMKPPSFTPPNLAQFIEAK